MAAAPSWNVFAPFPRTIRMPPGLRIGPDLFFKIRLLNRDTRLERTASGNIIVMPPAGLEGSYRSGDLFGQLRAWARRDGTGVATGSRP